jgi:tetratricopeptide (TPR) repeat protein
MKSRFVICLLLAAVTLAVFWQVGSNDFINFDDPGYVYENPHVVTGLTLENVRWAFTSADMGNWHPLAWLSHMTDCQIFGLNPRGHHFSSLILHTLNTLLLFLLLCRLTGLPGRSAFAAALFALHPLHVESVAWVAERKDVLSTFFWMLTLLAYARYVERPAWRRYSLVLVCFLLGLMAKPMLVTLPFVLLLLDYWPLGRMQSGRSGRDDAPQENQTEGASGRNRSLLSLTLEKAPFFALAAISSVITLYVQQKGGAVSSLESVPLQLRAANALLAWTGYIGKMAWPVDLSFLYPFDRSMPVWGAVPAGMFLLSVSLLAAWKSKKYPYLLVGWLWYLGTLVPVIGLVQIGLQSMADRYTYVPLIGLFIMIAWGVPDLLGRWRQSRIVLTAAAVVILSALATVTRLRLGDWKNSITLFTQAISISGNNFMAQNNLGVALAAQGRIEEAVSHFSAATAINPDYADPYYNLGNQLSNSNRIEEAVRFYRKAVQLRPANAQYLNNLGVALAQTGKREEALGAFFEAVRRKPDYADAHYNLGIALLEQGRIEEAASHFSEVVRIQPGHADARQKLEYASSLLRGGNPADKRRR